MVQGWHLPAPPPPAAPKLSPQTLKAVSPQTVKTLEPQTSTAGAGAGVWGGGGGGGREGGWQGSTIHPNRNPPGPSPNLKP